MSYTQPNPYSNGSVLDSSAIIANEESLKVFINQEITATEFATEQFYKSDIARGSIVQNNAEFVSSHISGINELQLLLNRSYQSSTTKNNSQTASIQWQDVANSGTVVNLDAAADVVVLMYMKYVVVNNTNVSGNKGQGNGMWQNEISLKSKNVVSGEYTIYSKTDNYCFEGAGSSLDTKDPGYDEQAAAHRTIMLSYKISLSAGTYLLTATVNPHNETGYTTVKSMTTEVFYI